LRAARRHLATASLLSHFEVQNHEPLKGMRQNENINHNNGIEHFLFYENLFLRICLVVFFMSGCTKSD